MTGDEQRRPKWVPQVNLLLCVHRGHIFPPQVEERAHERAEQLVDQEAKWTYELLCRLVYQLINYLVRRSAHTLVVCVWPTPPQQIVTGTRIVTLPSLLSPTLSMASSLARILSRGVYALFICVFYS